MAGTDPPVDTDSVGRKEKYTILNGVRAPFVGKWTLTYSPAHRRLIGCA